MESSSSSSMPLEQDSTVVMNHHPLQQQFNDENENDWTFQEFSETDEVMTSDQNQRLDHQHQSQLPFPPPQLHPAVSMGMHKVSSCYFSIGSHESMNDLLLASKDDTYKSCADDFDWDDDDDDEKEEADNRSIQFDAIASVSSQDDILYHDILMNVFTFLDASSLASFSETARRPNFEVFYFLQLQLQRSLLVELPLPSPSSMPQQPAPHASDELTAIAGSAILSRLAKLDPPRAQAIVEDYLQSNSTLKRMPLSHSIAYMRHYFLQRHHQFPENMSSPQALASAAVLATVVGAAYMTGGDLESTGELPQMLFRFGFVGSLMGAASRKMADGEVAVVQNKTNKEYKQEEEEEAKEATTTVNTPTTTTPQFRFPSLFEMKKTLTATLRDSNNSNTSMNNKSSPATNHHELKPMLSNPYDHHEDEKEQEEKVDMDESTGKPQQQSRKMPSGCLGAYSRAIQASQASIVEIVKTGRKNRFATLTVSHQARQVATLLDACSMNDGLQTVQELSYTMDLDAFYVGSDGSETCALHTAAFHGAHLVVDWLLQGIDDNSSGSQDGGLCCVDARDSNGWTALHFAAGSNSVDCVQILAKHGAKLSLEANNGYSPLQWARRLSNTEVEEALTELLQHDYSSQAWRTQPLTSLANRFFSLIPSR